MTRADRIEAAARALLAAFGRLDEDAVYPCERGGCCCLAMVTARGGVFCDECAAGFPDDERFDRSYAPAIRALRAALAEVTS